MKDLKDIIQFKKSQLQLKKAKFKLKNMEQEIILDSASKYFDLIFKTKKNYLIHQNVRTLFERQVETDKARLQKGEINFDDLAQSESSLAGANAKLIKAKLNF